MGWMPAPEQNKGGSQSGIALFMVIAAMTVLSVLVTEFTYVTQVNQKMAFDGLDQLKAHYLAKSGLKLSLLRIKAYMTLKNFSAKQNGMIPKQILDKIWSFPFMYPLPTNIPGLSLSAKDSIEKFQNESKLEGRYTATIDSDSSRYNLNSILASYAAPAAQPSPSPSASPNPNPVPSGAPVPNFEPEVARKSLSDFIGQIMDNKAKEDPDFASEYRDVRLEDLINNIVSWADWTQERRTLNSKDSINPKKAPFYTINELHMIDPIDDKLFDLLAPNFTVSPTPGINVNSIQEQALMALIPNITKEEVTEFYKFRDSTEADNSFKTSDDFFNYLLKAVSVFKNSQEVLNTYKNDLNKRGIRIVTEETFFKITVQAQVNRATRLLEAWVKLTDASQSAIPNPNPSNTPGNTGVNPNLPPSSIPIQNLGEAPKKNDPGLKITFMRIL